jgi:hypothetical protein
MTKGHIYMQLPVYGIPGVSLGHPRSIGGLEAEMPAAGWLQG